MAMAMASLVIIPKRMSKDVAGLDCEMAAEISMTVGWKGLVIGLS